MYFLSNIIDFILFNPINKYLQTKVNLILFVLIQSYPIPAHRPISQLNKTMNKNQIQMFIRGSSKDKNPCSLPEPAKYPPKGISLVSSKLDQRHSNMSTCKGSQIDDKQEQYSSESDQRFQQFNRNSFKKSKRQKSTYDSDDQATGRRSSNINPYDQEYDASNLPEDSVITQFRETLELNLVQAKVFDTVKQRFHQKINEPCQREYQFVSLTHEQKTSIKNRRIALNKAYFHLCNRIFNVKYSQEEIRLIDSIFEGQLKTIEASIKLKPDLLKFHTNFTNYNLLYIAAMSGHTQIVQFFLKKDQCLDFKTGRSLPLNVAAWCGHYSVIKLLIDYEVPHNAKNLCFRQTAVEQTENTEVIQLLNDVHKYKLNQIMAQKMTAQQKCLLLSVIAGKFQTTKSLIQKNKQLVNFNSSYNNFSLLSIAIMSQDLPTVKFILKTGCYLSIAGCYTTPLHIAVQTGNIQIVELLLKYGLPHNFTDRYGFKPIQLTHNGEMKSMLQKADEDKINRLAAQLIQKGLLIGVINIFDERGNFFGRKLILKNYLKHFPNHKDAFHGTEFQNLLSIAQHNLVKPGTKIGDKTTQVRPGHIQQNQTFNNMKNWNNAIYTTPSIYYAGQCYSVCTSSKDLVVNDILNLAPVVQVKVKNGTFDQYRETSGGEYKPRKDEPKLLEFRSQIIKGQEDNVMVVAIILSTEDHFAKMEMSFEKITDLALNTKDQQLIRMYREAQKKLKLN